MSRSNAVRYICVAASLGALVALVLVLRDREGGSERPVVPLRVDDDGSSDLPLRVDPTDPWLPAAALQAPLPQTQLTEVLDARAVIDLAKPVVIDVPEEPEPARPLAMPAASSAFGDAATAAVLLLLTVARIRRDAAQARGDVGETRHLTGALSPSP